MISFIVIGQNIERTIQMSLDSIVNYVSLNKIWNYEIIYVDSDSKDKSIDLAKNYPIRIFEITGDVNAAIGRNVGAKNAKGEVLFFIDGDMEIFFDSYDYTFNKSDEKPIHPFIGGNYHHYYYDSKFNKLFSKDEIISKQTVYKYNTGGLMIIEKYLWEQIKGMDERLIRNEDIDLGIRLSNLGILALIEPHFFVNHHTTSYFENKRLFNLYKTRAFFAPGLLMRKHMFNLVYLKMYHRTVFYVLLLIIALLCLILNPLVSLTLFCLYILIQAIRVLLKASEEKYLMNSFLFKVLYNIYVLIGLMFFYPGKKTYNVKGIIVAE